MPAPLAVAASPGCCVYVAVVLVPIAFGFGCCWGPGLGSAGVICVCPLPVVVGCGLCPGVEQAGVTCCCSRCFAVVVLLWCTYAYMNNLKLSLLSWNVRGLGQDERCRDVLAELVTSRPSLSFLQETKLPTAPFSREAQLLPPFSS